LAKKSDPLNIPANLPFEEAVAELESLLQAMESGQQPLEASLAAYRRGALLLRHCQQQLADAEERLRVLEGEELKPLTLDAEKGA
jgi:exodeoxyribonuclease VII small subunit